MSDITAYEIRNWRLIYTTSELVRGDWLACLDGNTVSIEPSVTTLWFSENYNYGRRLPANAMIANVVNGEITSFWVSGEYEADVEKVRDELNAVLLAVAQTMTEVCGG